MVRAALTQPRRLGRGPRAYAAYVPATTVVAASLLAALPIMSTSGWYPDFGFLVFISWRLLRADPWPAWWAAPLGFVNDLFTGYPVGISIALWSATMLALDLIDRATEVELQRLTDGSFSGTCQDIRKGRRTENDFMNGYVAQKGRSAVAVRGSQAHYSGSHPAVQQRRHAQALVRTPGTEGMAVGSSD